MGVKLIKDGNYLRFPKFDEQDVYELFDVNSIGRDLVIELRKLCLKGLDLLPEGVEKEEFRKKLSELIKEEVCREL